MNCRHLRPGDAVAVCYGRWRDDRRYERGVVARVSAKNVWLADGRMFAALGGGLVTREPAGSCELMPLTDEVMARIDDAERRAS